MDMVEVSELSHGEDADATADLALALTESYHGERDQWEEDNTYTRPGASWRRLPEFYILIYACFFWEWGGWVRLLCPRS